MNARGTVTNPTGSQALGIREVAAFLRRGALFALLVAVVAAAAAYEVTRRSTPVYQATVALLAAQPGPGYGGAGLLTPAPVDPGVYQTALMESAIVPTALTQLLGRAPTDKQVQAFEHNVHVSLQKLDISSVIRLSVDSADPRFAADAVNALADGLVEWDRRRAQSALSGAAAALQQSIQEIDAELGAQGAQAPSAERAATLRALRQEREHQLTAARATSEASVPVGLLSPLSRAVPPQQAIGPKVAFKTLVAGLLGLILAFGLWFLRWTLDPRLRDREELASLTGRPVLAEFPASRRRRQGDVVEAATFLRSNIMLVARSGPPLVLAISSPRHVHEKEGIGAALTESLVRAGHRTLLVDADLRHLGTGHGLNGSKTKAPPLEAYLEAPDVPHAPVPIAIGRKLAFDFVPSFTTSAYPAELLNRSFGALLRRWRESYDVIVVDCPPVLPYADTLAIAPLCTGLVLCVRQAESTRQEVAESVERLTQVGVNVLGSVLGDARVRHEAAGEAASPASRQEPGPADPYRIIGSQQTFDNVRVRPR